MKTYLITVNGTPLTSKDTVRAESRDSAINKWTVAKYGSVFSSCAPYNIGAMVKQS